MKKKTVILFLAFLFIFALGSKCFADEQNEIQNLEIAVRIQENGDAVVTEKWVTNTIGNIEYKRDISMISKDRIENFIIMDDIENRQKPFNIVERENKIEISWKEEQEGFHSYTVEYTIKSLVRQFQDKDGFLIDFLSSEIFPQLNDIQINIKLPFEVSKKYFKISKFGFNGDVKIGKDNVSISNVRAFKNIILLGEFQTGEFQNLVKQEGKIRKIEKQLEKENPTKLKNVDIIMIVILCITASGYVIIEGYYLVKNK